MTSYHNFTTTIVVGVNSAQFFGKIRIKVVNGADSTILFGHSQWKAFLSEFLAH